MTREEAIQTLIDMANALCLNPDTPQGIALKMSIKALEQEQNIDDIKTEIKSLINEYDERCDRWKTSRIESNKWGERAEGLERALKIIDKHINGKESEEQHD